TPESAKKARLTAVRLTAYPRFSKSDTSNDRWSLRASLTTNTTSTSTPNTIGTSTEADVQLCVSEAWMMPYTRETRPTTDSASPVRSSRWGLGLRVSGTTRQMPMSPAMTIGTLMRKTEPQSLPVSQLVQAGYCRSRPPRTGPRATAP